MKYTIERCHSVFTRCGYKVSLFNDDGSPHTRLLRVQADIDGAAAETLGPA